MIDANSGVVTQVNKLPKLKRTCARLLLSVLCLAPITHIGAAASEPHLLIIPETCSYLTEDLGLALMSVAKSKISHANFHMPNFWSQCIHSGHGVVRRKVSFIFKFMVWDMFDVDNLAREQLEFNAHFASGALPLVARLDSPGKATMVFEKEDHSVVMLLTGIRGPHDGAGRDSMLVATYSLTNSALDHAQRTARLLDLATQHYAEWLAAAS
ncbi:MAG: hypothetical protein ACR2PZ_27495 [Pseudomonadales bacterium]